MNKKILILNLVITGIIVLLLILINQPKELTPDEYEIIKNLTLQKFDQDFQDINCQEDNSIFCDKQPINENTLNTLLELIKNFEINEQEIINLLSTEVNNEFINEYLELIKSILNDLKKIPEESYTRIINQTLINKIIINTELLFDSLINESLINGPFLPINNLILNYTNQELHYVAYLDYESKLIDLLKQEYEINEPTEEILTLLIPFKETIYSELLSPEIKEQARLLNENKIYNLMIAELITSLTPQQLINWTSINTQFYNNTVYVENLFLTTTYEASVRITDYLNGIKQIIIVSEPFNLTSFTCLSGEKRTRIVKGTINSFCECNETLPNTFYETLNITDYCNNCINNNVLLNINETEITECINECEKISFFTYNGMNYGLLVRDPKLCENLINDFESMTNSLVYAAQKWG